MDGAGAIPTRNWSAGSFEHIGNINSEAFQKIKTGNRGCYQCALSCRQVHEVAGVKGEGPEFETIALCGSNCGMGDIEALMRFNRECDEWGLDTISSGSVVALAMDLTEKGIADFGVRFGEPDGYLRMPGLIARREGPGAELALGARALAAKYGVPELAMEVKNLELAGLRPARDLRHEPGLRDLRPRRLPHAHLPGRGRDLGGHAASRQPGGQGGQGHRRPGLGRLHRPELQLGQVQRYLV